MKKPTKRPRKFIPTAGPEPSSIDLEFFDAVLGILKHTRKAMGLPPIRKIRPGTPKRTTCPIANSLNLSSDQFEIIHTKHDGIGAFVYNEDLASKLTTAWQTPCVRINSFCWFIVLPELLEKLTLLYDCYVLPELIN